MDFFGTPSLGNNYRDTRNMVRLLQSMRSGMDAYLIVFRALESKHGKQFRDEFFKELHR